jgi:ABC-type transport system substrate-binding protein
VRAFAPGSVYFNQILPSGDFEVALFSWVWSPGASWSDVYGCRAASNFTGYCQRLVTAVLDQAGRILDEARRAAALNRADKQLARDVPSIPLYQFILTAAYSTSVRNYLLPTGIRSGTRRTGGLRSSPVASSARLSLLQFSPPASGSRSSIRR